VCQFATVPEFKYYSASDQTGHFPGLSCTKLAGPPPGTGATSWYRFWKLLELLEHLP
jgi:hypothetical protein